MKKELAAVALLIAIFSCAFWNTRHLKSLLGELQSLNTETFSLASAENWDEAEEKAQTLAQNWEKVEPYTHVFIRHSEIDAVSDAICALQGAVNTHDSAVCLGAALTVETHLTGIWKTERLSLGSIF